MLRSRSVVGSSDSEGWRKKKGSGSRLASVYTRVVIGLYCTDVSTARRSMLNKKMKDEDERVRERISQHTKEKKARKKRDERKQPISEQPDLAMDYSCCMSGVHACMPILSHPTRRLAGPLPHACAHRVCARQPARLFTTRRRQGSLNSPLPLY